MEKKKHLKHLLISAMAAMTLVIGACAPPGAGASEMMTEEEAGQIAEDFVRNSPTFAFDGIDHTLQLVETLYPDMENVWQFVFHFESRQAGYGDRTGQMLLQVITPHEVIVTVAQGKVTSALMDGKWDMIEQSPVDSGAADAARQVAEDFVRNSPTFAFDGIEDTLKLINTAAYSGKTISADAPTSNETNGWEFAFEFDSAQAGYGDRTGQMLPDVITPHVAVIVVENGEVKSAVMDEKWDMISQEML